MSDRSIPVVIEQDFKVDTATLWNAITDHETMIKWYFENMPDFKPIIGFQTKFLIENEGRKFTHIWTIAEVLQGEKISYTWEFEEHPGKGLVVFEVSKTETGSHLKLTNHGLDSFPEDIPEFQRESCVGGWNYFIKERLKEFLD